MLGLQMMVHEFRKYDSILVVLILHEENHL